LRPRDAERGVMRLQPRRRTRPRPRRRDGDHSHRDDRDCRYAPHGL